MSRPDENKYPEWASDLGNVFEPPEAQKDTGWVIDQIPPSGFENWIQNTTFNWVQYFDESINGFSAQENSPPDLTVVINAGILRYGDQNVQVPQQTSAAFTAPVTFPKIVGTFVHRETGALLNAEGAEAPLPSAPNIPDGYFPTFLTQLSVAQTEITNEQISEFRANFESLSPELKVVIEDSGQTPDPTNVSQISNAIGNLSASSTSIINSNYNILQSDSGRLLACDSSSGDINLSLQNASIMGGRFSIIIKKTSEQGRVTVTTVGGGIDGKLQVSLNVKNSAIKLVSDGISSYKIASTFNEEHKNILVGGNISTNLFQSGTSTNSGTTPPNNNNTYVADQWVLQSDGNNVVNVSRTGASVLDSSVVTANRKWGFIIPIEGEIYRRLNGFACSIGVEAAVASGTLSNLRIALLSSGPGATTNVVSSWNAAGADPTLNSPWTYQNTPQNIPIPTTTPMTLSAENIIVSANPPNIGAVFIWVDDTTASIGATLSIRRAALVKSPIFTGYQEEGVEGILAQYRYYQKTYNNDVRPGTVTDAGSITFQHPTNTNPLHGLSFRTAIDMRATPTVTAYSPTTGDSGNVAGNNDNNRAVTGITRTGRKSSGVVSISGSQTANDVYKAHFVLNSRL